jgi:hypothetical protein
MERSSCALDVAVFEMKSAEALIHWLETMPTVTELQIVTRLNYISLIKLLQRLSYDLLGTNRLCPKLQAISLPNDSPLDPPALFAFLNSRRKLNPHIHDDLPLKLPSAFTFMNRALQPVQLKRITQVCSSMPEKALLVGLRKFQEEGLQVSFNDTHGVSWFDRTVEV